jgi:hypothetical protein
MNFLKSITGELLIGLLAILAALTLGYTQGIKHNEQAHQADQAKVVLEAKKQYDAKQAEGEKDAAKYLADNRAFTTQFINLTEKFHALKQRVPLVIPSQHCAGFSSGLANIQKARRSADGPSQDRALRDVLDSANRSSILVTDGAAWMWNSALTGTDQPSGACSAANPTAAACAAETSLSLDDIWDNHTANAQACAANRLAHQALIDHIQKNQPSAP